MSSMIESKCEVSFKSMKAQAARRKKILGVLLFCIFSGTHFPCLVDDCNRLQFSVCLKVLVLVLAVVEQLELHGLCCVLYSL